MTFLSCGRNRRNCIVVVCPASEPTEHFIFENNVRILVVEDEPKAGDYLKSGLTESGYVVDLARNGVDGLHLAREFAYDAIVLDVMMPQMDGWQVLEQLREHADTPVLFLSARGVGYRCEFER